jgi:hypothetical protein
MNFLNRPPFIITDIVNASASDLLNPSPDAVFITEAKFYDQNLTPPALERDMLLYPEIYKIYQPH